MDRFEHEGKTYVAKDSNKACHSADGLGTPCAFYNRESLPRCGPLDECCTAHGRADRRYIIWVEEEQGGRMTKHERVAREIVKQTIGGGDDEPEIETVTRILQREYREVSE